LVVGWKDPTASFLSAMVAHLRFVNTQLILIHENGVANDCEGPAHRTLNDGLVFFIPLC
jgi:hypothetical protein